MTNAPSTEASKRFRSPPYPAMGLGKAIERAKQLYAKALHHPVGVNVLADSWGYAAKSSGLWATAAAMIQFGFLTDEGTGDKRKFQLTDGAIRIIRDADPNSPKRKEAIQRAALAPKIHKELWDRFGNTTELSDVVLKNYLTLDRSEAGEAAYSDQAADMVIEVYKQTILFAGLREAIITDVLEDKAGDQDLARPLPPSENPPMTLNVQPLAKPGFTPPPPKPGMMQEVFNLDEGPVTLSVPANMSAQSYEDLEDYLKLFLRKAKRRATAQEVFQDVYGEDLGKDGNT
jgi:Plant specific mitochondrial import receptor subunit TOM20